MPRAKTITDVGYLETQWTSKGELVCVVSATVTVNPDDSRTITQVMHQFTQPGDLGVFIRDLARARRKAFVEKDETVIGPIKDEALKELHDREEKHQCYNVLVDHYSKEIEKIYKDGSASLNTWTGLMNAFLLDILRTNDSMERSRLFELLTHGFDLESFMALEEKNRNALLGIPGDEEVSFKRYVDMFQEIMETHGPNSSER